MSTLRVLHAHSGNLYGGVETLLELLARTSDETMRSDFALCFEGRCAQELRAAGANVYDLGPARYSRPWTVWRARRALRQRLRQQPPAVVIVHSGWGQALFGPVVRTAGIPLVRWVHAPPDPANRLDRWARGVPADLALCNSRYTHDHFAAYEPRVRSELYYLPVAPPDPSLRKRRDAMRADLQASERAVAVIQVSRMEAWKGQGVLLEALAELGDEPRWTAWQVGGAQRDDERRYFESLQRQSAALGLDARVQFLGERHDVPALLAAADIHCQPNAAPEPFGLTFVEALYAGLPVVTFDMGGPRDIVDETCGVLVPPGDLPGLCGALRRLITDEAFRLALAAAAPARARALCDPASQIPRLAELLATVA